MVTNECNVNAYVCLNDSGTPIEVEPAYIDDCQSLGTFQIVSFTCLSDEPIASPSSFTNLATTSAYIDIASTSAIATGFHNFFLNFALVSFVVVSYVGFKFGSWLYRR
jgi:hypothetical protein